MFANALHPGLPHEAKPMLEKEGIHGAGAGIGLDAPGDSGVTSELTAIYSNIQRILDIRHVDILSARMLDPGEIPVFIITCRTQEVHVYRQKKTGELAAGMDDKVQQVTYAIGVTRIPEDVNNPETRGWRLIELQKSARDYL